MNCKTKGFASREQLKHNHLNSWLTAWHETLCPCVCLLVNAATAAAAFVQRTKFQLCIKHFMCICFLEIHLRTLTSQVASLSLMNIHCPHIVDLEAHISLKIFLSSDYLCCMLNMLFHYLFNETTISNWVVILIKRVENIQ